jgi:glycosyltransferase involved in cell wall biosynthesis
LDTPFNQEMLQEGKYGDFFSKNTEDVTRCIYEHEETPQLLTNLRANARNGLTEKYNWDYVTSQYLEVFRNLKKRQINQ